MDYLHWKKSCGLKKELKFKTLLMNMIPFFYVKEQKFGLEIEQKRKCLEEELRRKVVEVEKKETRFNYMKADSAFSTDSGMDLLGVAGPICWAKLLYNL